MRILLQNSIFHPNVIGGAENSSLLLARELSRRGHRVDVLASSGRRSGSAKTLTERRIDGIDGTVHEAPSHGFVDLLEGEDGRASLPRRVLHHAANVRSRRWRDLTHELLARLQPDLLHTNTIVGMTGSIWSAAADAGVPVLHTLRDYHLLCPRTTLLRSSGEECVNAPLPCRVYRGLKRGATDHVDVVTAPSRFVLQRHLDMGHFRNARAEVVHNACDPPVEPVPERDQPRIPRAVYLGQLDEHKGVGLLLTLLQQWFEDPEAPPLQFAFAGAGPMEERVRSFCGAWPQRCSFHGFVDGHQKDRLLRGSDVLLVPSVWNDNFPRVMLDAFRYALPVIGSNRGGIPEVVEDGGNGTIVEPTVEELRRALEAYVRQPELRRRHGRQGHADARRYLLERQVDAFLELYRSLLGAPAR